MPTNYLYGTILTGEAVAANNRGEYVGNTATLQKVFVGDDLHTSVSAEAIRFALRWRFQLEGLPLNRTYDAASGRLAYADRAGNAAAFADDDLFGFMDVAAAGREREDEESEAAPPPGPAPPSTTARKGARGRASKRAGPLAVGRAVSLRPYRGEVSFNAVSGVKEKGRLSLYSTEMHSTEYQYGFGLNLDDVVDKRNIAHLVEAIVDPPRVAGNHARFAYDFAPASAVFRVTHAHAPRILGCFEHDEARGVPSLRGLIRRVRAGDISAQELIVAGEIADTDEGGALRALGVTVVDGVRAASRLVLERIAGLGLVTGAARPRA